MPEGRKGGGREGLISLDCHSVQSSAMLLTSQVVRNHGEEEISDLLSMVGWMPIVCQTGFMDSVVQGSGNCNL